MAPYLARLIVSLCFLSLVTPQLISKNIYKESCVDVKLSVADTASIVSLVAFSKDKIKCLEDHLPLGAVTHREIVQFVGNVYSREFTKIVRLQAQEHVPFSLGPDNRVIQSAAQVYQVFKLLNRAGIIISSSKLSPNDPSTVENCYTELSNAVEAIRTAYANKGHSAYFNDTLQNLKAKVRLIVSLTAKIRGVLDGDGIIVKGNKPGNEKLLLTLDRDVSDLFGRFNSHDLTGFDVAWKEIRSRIDRQKWKSLRASLSNIQISTESHDHAVQGDSLVEDAEFVQLGFLVLDSLIGL